MLWYMPCNSGGKALKKHEVTMSILEAYWPNAKTKEILSDKFHDDNTRDQAIEAAISNVPAARFILFALQ